MTRRVLLANILNPTIPIETCSPYLGLGYLASTLRQSYPDEFDIRIVNGSDVLKTLVEWKADIVGLSSSSQYYGKAINLARCVKNLGIPVIMGGVHISALPETMTKDIDVAVVGEGEQTFSELMGHFSGHGWIPNQLEEIKGIAYWQEDVLLRVNQPREPLSLDTLPMPARDLMTIGRSTSMFTSRGCPYRCTFCFSTRFWEKLRFFSAEYVVNEIEMLYRDYGVRSISFLDDLFIADKKRLQKIVKILDEHRLLGKLTYICNVRSNLIDDDLVQLLSFMGVHMVGMGIESGCQRTLEYLKGRGNVTIHDHANALRILRRYRIKVHSSIIIGSPEETWEDAMETVRFIKDNNLNDFDVYVLTPFPATPVWDYARTHDLVSNDMDWSRLSVDFKTNPNPVIVSERMTKAEITKLYLQLVQRNQRYIRREYLKAAVRSPWLIPVNVLRGVRR